MHLNSLSLMNGDEDDVAPNVASTGWETMLEGMIRVWFSDHWHLAYAQ